MIPKGIRTAMIAAGCMAGVLAAGAAGCGGESGPARRDPAEPPRLVILGIDGFDWRLTDPLMEQGRMPVLENLLRQGVRADLLTLVPLEKSPVIWTTIATGKVPTDKGRGFLVPGAAEDGSRDVYTAWHRTTRAFWNILSERDVSVSVLGWLETWPAETVRGTLVTDYVKYFTVETAAGDTSNRTYPPELYPEIQPFVVFPGDVKTADLARFLGEPDSLDRPEEPRLEEGLRGLRWIWAGDLTFTALAREFLANRREDVMAVYLRGPDAVCHQFWGDRDEAAEANTSYLTRQFGSTIDRYFEETDRLIGEILEEIDLERTSLLIVSDHGFQGPRRGLDGTTRQGIYMHRELGTAFLAGPWAVGAGIEVPGLRVMDILPTVLHALGLPVAEDLDGEVAWQLLGPEGGRERELRTVPTFETSPLERSGEAPESPVAEEIREQVEALGYAE